MISFLSLGTYRRGPSAFSLIVVSDKYWSIMN